jgi:hypothetical protein
MNYELFVSLHQIIDNMLELKDATLALDGRKLFSRLSLMAQDGQLTCITGPSGAGKTALIEVLLGLRLLDEGLVSIDGELLTPLSAPTFRRLIAYVPQKRPVTISQSEADTEGLETVWSPYNSCRYRLTAIDEHLDVAPMASKPIIIVDDPDAATFSLLPPLAAKGHTVVVASCREDVVNSSDVIITLGNDNHLVS